MWKLLQRLLPGNKIESRQASQAGAGAEAQDPAQPSVAQPIAPDSFVAGDIFHDCDLEELAAILAASGIDAQIGPWKLSLFGPPGRFHLRYVGNVDPEAPFTVDGNCYNIPLETVESWCLRLAACLDVNAIAFEYTHYSSTQQEIRTYKSRPNADCSVCPGRPLAALVLDSSHLPARRIEYRGCIEGVESIYIVEVPRTPQASLFETLIQLMSIEIHWREEWAPTQTTENAELVVKHWIIPELALSRFQESPVEEVRREIDERMRDTIPYLQPGPRNPRAGVFVDDIRLPDGAPLPAIDGPIISGVILRSEWNDLDVLYVTERHIGRMTWGTGA